MSGGCAPSGPGNPNAEQQSGPGAFDLGAHLAGLLIYAMEDPAKAEPLGWFIIFSVKGERRLSLQDLAKGHASLPDGHWKKGDDPRSLMAAVPVFSIAHGGELLTEPRELVGVDWGGPDHYFTLFDAMTDRLPFMIDRAESYWDVIQDWYSTPPPEPGMEKVCRQYAALYNRELYYEAYKLLEMRWMTEEGPGKDLLRGLMQLALGLHQIETGKFAMQQLEEAYGRIRTGREVFPFPTAERFLKRLEKATRLIKAYGPDQFQTFDLKMFPKVWLESPWKKLFRFGR